MNSKPILAIALLSIALAPFGGATHPGTSPCGPAEVYLPADSESKSYDYYVVVTGTWFLLYVESNGVDALQRDDPGCYHAGFDESTSDTYVGIIF